MFLIQFFSSKGVVLERTVLFVLDVKHRGLVLFRVPDKRNDYGVSSQVSITDLHKTFAIFAKCR